MTTAAPNPYLRTKVMTASPAELRLMLLEGAIRFLTQASDGLAEGDHEKSFNGFTRCQAIVMELLSGLDGKQDPDLCSRLSALYTYMYTRLVHACVEHDRTVAEEVLSLLRYEHETWVMLMRQLEGGSAADQEPEPAVTGVSVEA